MVFQRGGLRRPSYKDGFMSTTEELAPVGLMYYLRDNAVEHTICCVLARIYFSGVGAEVRNDVRRAVLMAKRMDRGLKRNKAEKER
jgi:hypothetical protein